MWKLLWIAVFAPVLLIASRARADEWTAPTVLTLASPNRKLEVVITPSSGGKAAATAAIGPPGAPGPAFALATPWMPVDAVLFDDGSLLTLDTWHQLGHGQVATLHEPGGRIRWTKTLVELVGQQVADDAPQSVSSIWWRKRPLEWSLAKDGKSGLITLYDEHRVRVAVRDGAAALVAVANLPDDPARLLNRARALARRDGKAAIAVLERVIAKDAGALAAAELYVEILQRANDHARVAALLDRVSPRWKTQDGYEVANVCVAWAASLRALARPADAERVLRRAIRATPTYSNPAVALAALLADEGRRGDADVVLDDFVGRLLKASYLDTHALAAAADFYRQRKDLAKALALYQKGYRRDQVTSQFLYASLAQLHEEMGNLDEAIRIDEQLLAHFVAMGSAFDAYRKQTADELARLRAKRRP